MIVVVAHACAVPTTTTTTTTCYVTFLQLLVQPTLIIGLDIWLWESLDGLRHLVLRVVADKSSSNTNTITIATEVATTTAATV